jgi:hypothetical protein
MADREASVVRVERVVLLEVENKVGRVGESAEDSSDAGSRKRVKDSRSEERRRRARNGRWPKETTSLGPVFFVRSLLAHTGGCAVRWGRMS